MDAGQDGLTGHLVLRNVELEPREETELAPSRITVVETVGARILG